MHGYGNIFQEMNKFIRLGNELKLLDKNKFFNEEKIGCKKKNYEPNTAAAEHEEFRSDINFFKVWRIGTRRMCWNKATPDKTD